MTPPLEANSADPAEVCAPMFPNTEALEPGCYVENVHPYGRYDDYGIVLRAEAGADEPGDQGEVTVQYAIGGSVFGPSRNWRRTDRQPAWLARLRAEAI